MRRKMNMLKFAAALVAGGFVLGVNGCGIGQALSNFNPCGTILNCDPTSYDFLTSGYEGPGVDVNVDMSCVYPPYCDEPMMVPAGN